MPSRIFGILLSCIWGVFRTPSASQLARAAFQMLSGMWLAGSARLGLRQQPRRGARRGCSDHSCDPPLRYGIRVALGRVPFPTSPRKAACVRICVGLWLGVGGHAKADGEVSSEEKAEQTRTLKCCGCGPAMGKAFFLPIPRELMGGDGILSGSRPKSVSGSCNLLE